MDIQTIKKNLENTIAGKQAYLKTMRSDLLSGDHAIPREAQITVIEMINLNIVELQNILNDVNKCVAAGMPNWNVHNCPFTDSCHRID